MNCGGGALLALPRCSDKVENYQIYNEIHIIHYSNLTNIITVNTSESLQTN